MKKGIIIKTLITAWILALSGIFSVSNAQIIFSPKHDRNTNKDIYWPQQKRNSEIIIANRSQLPPGQAKKIYGEKSAKRFAPGQQKKNHSVLYSNKRNNGIFFPANDQNNKGNRGKKNH